MKKSLPVAESVDKNNAMPSKESIYQAMETITTPDAAQYFLEGILKKLEQTKMLEQSMPLVEAIRKFVDSIKAQRSETSAAPWSGDTRKSNMSFEAFSFQTLQENFAATAAVALGGKVIDMDFAISDDGQYVRAYSNTAEGVDEETALAMDTIFNAWLAKDHMISKGGVIYEGTDSGEIKKNDQGGDVRVTGDKLEKLKENIGSSEEGGLKKFVQDRVEEHKSTITLEVFEQKFPEPAPAAPAQAAVSESEESTPGSSGAI